MQPTPPSPSRRLALLAWIVVPALLAVCLAVLARNWLAASAGPAPPTAILPAPTALAPVPPAPTVAPPLPAATSLLTVPPTATAAPPSPTADASALALLSALPSSLSDVTPSDSPAPTPAPSPEGGGETSVRVSSTPPQVPTPAPEGGGESLPVVVPTNVPTLLPMLPPTVLPPTVLPPVPVPPTAVAAGGPTDPLTGLPADPAKLARVPLVVMIDNHPDAAPQSGLNQASLVIEALAEGGITRFETFFLSGDAPTVGPIRSARPYFVEWAYAFHPFYVHCGGSWEAVDLIREAVGTITNVDCFDGNMPFWRSNDRLMPHNLYSSTSQLWKLAARRGIQAPATVPTLLHSPALPPDQRPRSGTLSFVFSGLSRSDITWVYDPDSNSYLRKQWGYWHRDLETGDTISAKNVVVLWTNVWELPGDEKGRMGTDTVGAGTALILRDGRPTWGYWSRATPYQPLQLYNGARDPLALARGRTWIEVLGVGKKVTLGQ